MKAIWIQLKRFLATDFDAFSYGLTALMLAVLLWANYSLNLAGEFMYNRSSATVTLLSWGLMLGLPYLLTLYLKTKFKFEGGAKAAGRFSAMFGLAMVLICLNAWFPYHKQLAIQNFSPPLRQWGVQVFWNLKRILLWILPLLLFWLWQDRQQSKFYGLFKRGQHTWVYFLLLGLMLPLIIGASFSAGFQATYPQYFAGPAEAKVGISPWMTGSVFELVYGFDFLSVELMFRGFLVIGMSRVLGRHAVLPMAAMYCALHFGKPAGEAISSIFGGYILGVLALEHRSIWGGLIVHVGIAWLMELAAYLQRIF